MVGKPKALLCNRDANGKLMVWRKLLTIDVPQDFMGAVMEGLGLRKAGAAEHDRNGRLFAFKMSLHRFLTDTKGNGIMNHVFAGYEEYKGEIPVKIPWQPGCF